MGFLKKLFGRKPVEVHQEESTEEYKLSPLIISLDEAKKRDGWKLYKAKNVTQEEFHVKAKLFVEGDQKVNLGMCFSHPNTYISIDSDGGATLFDKETFEDTFELVT